jgi:hypothetical protein
MHATATCQADKIKVNGAESTSQVTSNAINAPEDSYSLYRYTLEQKVPAFGLIHQTFCARPLPFEDYDLRYFFSPVVRQY